MKTNILNVATGDEEILNQARAILASRAFVPVDAKTLLSNGNTYKELREYLAMDLAGLDVEHFRAYYFDPIGRLIKQVEIGKGDEKSTNATPREVARQGLLANATFVVVAHNHPNGDNRPSPADSKASLVVAKALDAVGLHLVEAFVVAGPNVKDVSRIPPPPRDPQELLKGLFGRGVDISHVEFGD